MRLREKVGAPGIAQGTPQILPKLKSRAVGISQEIGRLISGWRQNAVVDGIAGVCGAGGVTHRAVGSGGSKCIVGSNDGDIIHHAHNSRRALDGTDQSLFLLSGSHLASHSHNAVLNREMHGHLRGRRDSQLECRGLLDGGEQRLVTGGKCAVSGSAQ